MSAMSALEALSPLDGRYYAKLAPVREYFSELALIQARVRVELAYLRALGKVIDIGVEVPTSIPVDAQRIKDIEKVTNHDVKAVEYYLKEHLNTEYIHFGLTSQDVNHVAQPLLLKDFWETQLSPKYAEIRAKLATLAWEHREDAMLARTHGQAATPTLLGKEFAVFHERLRPPKMRFEAKFGGATGGLNAHYVAYPDIDWIAFADEFVSSFGLERQKYTTQIMHYDDVAEFCHALARLNTTLIDLCQDMWAYISLGYFKLQKKESEIGSSAMPHKVNPIDFENAEGNFGVANSAFEHLARKLPISRLQRDLSDSTVLRTIGTPLGHTFLALGSLINGFGKISVNRTALYNDLENNYAVISEAIQTILRSNNFPQPYEKLKDLTRGHDCGKDKFHKFISSLDIPDDLKSRLCLISPHTYVGKFDAEPFRPDP